MTVNRQQTYLISLIRELCNLPSEIEWVEFKVNNENPDAIGEYISALANSAVLHGKVNAYILWGVDDVSHKIVGTSFDWRNAKCGAEPLENWLLQFIKPKVEFKFHSVEVDDRTLVLLEIHAVNRHIVQFKNIEFIRIGSIKKKIKDFPEKERELWRIFDKIPFEQDIAADQLNVEEILRLLDYPAYFDLLNLPLPSSRDEILLALSEENLIAKEPSGLWNIRNLGAILLAKNISDFRTLKRKVVRVVLYKGIDRMEAIREQEGFKGYATGFEGLIQMLMAMLPSNEVIVKSLRKNVPLFPELAVRELVANALIHQDFSLMGTGPMIEIFANRIEITNPGLPLVKTERFLDSPPRSRNEGVASLLRRIGICEERGSGIDKVVLQTELYQLPAPIFEKTDEHTRIVLFSHKSFNDMDKSDRTRACYLHACLKYTQRVAMTNTTLRNRFGIEEHNRALVSRVIRDAVEAGLIQIKDESVGTRAYCYLPKWAV